MEAVPQLVKIKRILGEYIIGSKRQKLRDDRLRVMLGRSDAALDYGHVAAALFMKLAISECYTCGEAVGLTIAPIMGAGTLPFRGHVTPETPTV